MFNYLKIGIKLGAGLFFTLVFLVVVSTVSLLRFSNIASTMKIIFENQMPITAMTHELTENTLNIGRSVRNLVLSDDKSVEAQQLQKIAKLSQLNRDVIGRIKPMLNTEKGKLLFNKVEESSNQFTGALNLIIPLANSSSPTYNPQLATKYLFGEYSKVVNAELDALMDFASFQKAVSDGAVKLVLETADSVKPVLMASIILAMLCGWWFIRIIKRPLKDAIGPLKQAAGIDNLR